MKREFFCHSCMKWEPSERIGGVVSEKRYCVDTIDKARKKVAQQIEARTDRALKLAANKYTEAQTRAKELRLNRLEKIQRERELKQINEDIYGFEDE